MSSFLNCLTSQFRIHICWYFLDLSTNVSPNSLKKIICLIVFFAFFVFITSLSNVWYSEKCKFPSAIQTIRMWNIAGKGVMCSRKGMPCTSWLFPWGEKILSQTRFKQLFQLFKSPINFSSHFAPSLLFPPFILSLPLSPLWTKISFLCQVHQYLFTRTIWRRAFESNGVSCSCFDRINDQKQKQMQCYTTRNEESACKDKAWRQPSVTPFPVVVRHVHNFLCGQKTKLTATILSEKKMCWRHILYCLHM